jgi:predicted Zn-dependent protease
MSQQTSTLPPAKGRRKTWRLVGIGLLLVSFGGLAWLVIWNLQAAAHLNAAEEALERRDYRQALLHLESYLSTWATLASQPQQARARFLAAQTARRLGRHDEAAEYLRLCRDQGWDPDAIGLEEMLGALQRGDASVGPALWQRVQAEDPESLTILEVLIQHYLDSYRLYRTLECLNRYLKQRPNDLHALLGRAFVWERFLYFTGALSDYRRAVAHHPDSAAARLRLAKTLLIAGTPQEALEHFQHLEKREPGSPVVRLGIAQCRRRLGQREEARTLLDEVLAQQPDNADALWDRAQLALDEGKPVQAEPWLRRAVRRAPHDRKVYFSLYRCLDLQHKDKEAAEFRARADRIDANLRRLESLTRAVLRSPNDAALRCQVGMLFLENGEEQEGIRWLSQALRLDARCQEAQRALADHARRGGKPPERVRP